METNTVKITHIGNGVASLRIATDEQPYLGPSLVSELTEVVKSVAADETIRSIVVEGGARQFSAGGSRSGLLSREPMHSLLYYVEEMPRLVLSIPVPTIAAMAGHAIGGGLIIGLWCDLAILAEESLYGANFMALGITPGMGSTVVLEEAIGAPLARKLLFTGRLMKGRELKTAGGPLAHAIIPKACVRDRAVEIAREIAQTPREALLLLKRTLASRRRAKLERALSEEHTMHANIFAREETRLNIAERYMSPLKEF